MFIIILLLLLLLLLIFILIGNYYHIKSVFTPISCNVDDGNTKDLYCMDPNTFSYSMYALSVFTSFINIPPAAVVFVGIAILLVTMASGITYIILLSLGCVLCVIHIMLYGYSLHANKPLLNIFSPKYICNNKEYKCLNTEKYSILLIKIFSIICFIQTIIYMMFIIFIIFDIIFEDYSNKIFEDYINNIISAFMKLSE